MAKTKKNTSDDEIAAFLERGGVINRIEARVPTEWKEKDAIPIINTPSAAAEPVSVDASAILKTDFETSGAAQPETALSKTPALTFSGTLEEQFLRAQVELAGIKEELADVQRRVRGLNEGVSALAENTKIRLTPMEARVLRRLANDEAVVLEKISGSHATFLSRLRGKLNGVGIVVIKESKKPIYMSYKNQHRVRMLADKFVPPLSFQLSVSAPQIDPSMPIEERFACVQADLAMKQQQLMAAREWQQQLEKSEVKPVRNGMVNLTKREAVLLIRLMNEDKVNIDSIPSSQASARVLLNYLRAKLGILGIEVSAKRIGWIYLNEENKRRVRSMANKFSSPIPLRFGNSAPVREAGQPVSG